MPVSAIGESTVRRDGLLKVTGQAAYTADMAAAPDCAYAVLLQSPVAAGRLTEIDTADALAQPGVLAVLTHANMPRIAPAAAALSDLGRSGGSGFAGQQFLPVQDERIAYYGQHVAVAVAERLEQSAYAATLVRTRYEREPHVLDFDEAARDTFIPVSGWPDPIASSRGDMQLALDRAAARVTAIYDTALQHHLTMEPHATLAAWEGERLTVWEPSTFVYGVRKTLSAWLQMPEEHIRVINHFVGGSFGCKGPTWPHVYLAAVAARVVGRPVKLVLTRTQTFRSVGYRPHIRHRMIAAADGGGALLALAHHAVTHTAVFDDRTVAPVTKTTPKTYACPNVETSQRSAHMNLCGPFTFRGPGEMPGLFALECSLDELASTLGVDPIDLRRRSYAHSDPESGRPWASKHLDECYRQGAERFGWSSRPARPGQMRDGHWRVGMGMAGMMYDAKSRPTTARARIDSSGALLVQSSTCDQGTGSYTIMAQIAADALGVPYHQARFELGDTVMPMAPISAGSMTTASVGSAVKIACEALRRNLLALAFADPASPLHGLPAGAVRVAGGRAFAAADPKRGEDLADIAARGPGGFVEAVERYAPDESAQQAYSSYSFGAHFAQVHVDDDLGCAHVTRYVAAFDAGRIINPLTARSQLLGGIVWGIGMALMEQTRLDARLGMIVNDDLAEYHVPVNADIPRIDAFFVEGADMPENPLGVKGIGEIGAIGAAAAIANAIFHATGKRVRDLPITPDKLM